MKKTKGTKKYNSKDEVYFKCNKSGCGKVLFKVFGAIVHAKKGHGLSLAMEDIPKHFSEIKDPPRAVIDKIQKKKKPQEGYKKRIKAQQQPGDDEVNFECNACGIIVGHKTSLRGHCKRIHNKPSSEVGYKETNKPVTNPNYSKHKKTKRQEPDPELSGILEHMPQIIDVLGAEVVDGEVVLTFRMKMSTPWMAATIIPSLIPPLERIEK